MIKDNVGDGILAKKGNITMTDVEIVSNGGDGVRAVGTTAGSGAVFIQQGNTLESKITGNQGGGILASGCMELFPDQEGCTSVVIEAPVVIELNRGWGIEAEGGVRIGAEPDGLGPRVQSNSNFIDSNGGGGIFSDGGIVTVFNADVSFNVGPGIWHEGGGAVRLFMIDIRSNNGDGVRAGGATGLSAVEIISSQGGNVGDTEFQNRISNNKGKGIKANGCLEIDPDADGCTSVDIQAQVGIISNGSWGIEAKGRVFMGVESDRATPLSKTSFVNDNGWGEECFKLDDAGNLIQTDCSGGGVFSNDDIVIRNAQICGNKEGDIVTEGDLDVSKDVVFGDKCTGSTPKPTPMPTPIPGKSFTFECDRNFLTGPIDLERLVLELGENEACILKLTNLEPGSSVEVSTNLRTGFRSSIKVDPISGVTNANGELEFTISAVDKGIDWVAWTVPNEKGEFKFNKKAFDTGLAWGMFVEVK